MVTLKPVDQKNVWELLRLQVAPEQRDFVATNTESIVEAYTTITAGGVALPFGIYSDETPVGFLMIGYGDIPNEENPPVSAGNYCIWRLMIDRGFQGRGLGARVVCFALEYIETLPCGPAQVCWLSYEPENTAAAALYHAFGFCETGGMDGDEIIAVRPLSAPER